MRAVIYARYSTDRQGEASIEDQLRVCRELAAAKGWEVAGEFCDRGISGAAEGNRDGWQAAKAALGAGDVLLANDTYRLARSQDLAPLVTRLKFRGVRVVCVMDSFDSESDTAGMQAGMSGIMSEEYRKYVARRTHSALSMRARQGLKVTKPAFDDVELVREIFSRFAGGESMFAIAGDLNRRGIPSPGAEWKARSRPRGKWLVSTLHALLRNERYIGRAIWNKSRWVKDPDTGKRHRRERPREEWIEAPCDRVIDQATWDRCQARMVTRPGKGGVSSYILSGLLVCGLCGGKLIVAGGSQRRYVCGTRHGGGDAACSNRSGIPRVLAEKHILEPLEQDLLSPEAEAEGLRQMRLVRTELEKGLPVENHELVELERLVKAGVLSREVAQPAIDAARRKAAETRSAVTGRGLPWPSATTWRAAVRSMGDVLRGSDITAARGLLRELVGEVRCVPEGRFVVAEIAARRIRLDTAIAERHVLLGTGSGVGIWVGSGGPLRIHIPISTRRR